MLSEFIILVDVFDYELNFYWAYTPLVCQDNSILYGKVFSLTLLMFPPQVRCTFYDTYLLITFDTEAQYT